VAWQETALVEVQIKLADPPGAIEVVLAIKVRTGALGSVDEALLPEPVMEFSLFPWPQPARKPIMTMDVKRTLTKPTRQKPFKFI
jgi:hypothetical protein